MKEQYIHMRKTSQYAMEWFYKYFHEHPLKKIEIPFEAFMQVFQMYFSFNSESVLAHLDREFGLTITTYQDKVIDVY